MKKLIKKSLLIVAVFSAIVTTTANENAKLKLINAKLINLELKNSDGNVQVRVKDVHGVVLHKENYNGIQFSKKYDLSDLPSGNYFFEIEGETKIKKMPFSVNLNTVIFNNKIEEVYYKPVVRRKDELIYISKASVNSNSLQIELYNDAEVLLYKEDVTGNVDLGKTLNISLLNKGNYRLVMKSDNKIFTKEIKK